MVACLMRIGQCHSKIEGKRLQNWNMNHNCYVKRLANRRTSNEQTSDTENVMHRSVRTWRYEVWCVFQFHKSHQIKSVISIHCISETNATQIYRPEFIVQSYYSIFDSILSVSSYRMIIIIIESYNKRWHTAIVGINCVEGAYWNWYYRCHCVAHCCQHTHTRTQTQAVAISKSNYILFVEAELRARRSFSRTRLPRWAVN